MIRRRRYRPFSTASGTFPSAATHWGKISATSARGAIVKRHSSRERKAYTFQAAERFLSGSLGR
jgi:hypothetical protein